jgi:hypothetical protein
VQRQKKGLARQNGRIHPKTGKLGHQEGFCNDQKIWESGIVPDEVSDFMPEK